MTKLPYNRNVYVAAVREPPDPMLQDVGRLEARFELLPNLRDREFAKDLVKSFKKRGHLSTSQADWVKKLLVKIHAVQNPEAAPEPTAVLDASFAKIRQLFLDARTAGLKYPKIRLETEDGQKVVLRMATDQSKYSGQVTVTDATPTFEMRTYFGRVDEEGKFHGSQSVTPAVTKLLQDLARNPAKMAALYGHKTSTCCFCGLKLDTSESVAVGYGPICAEKFRLPWGHVAPTTYTKMEIES